MNTYTAYFYTDAEYASTEIEASTPQEALQKAQVRNDLENCDGLIFDHYDEGQPVNHIEILDADRNELAHWRDADLRLRMAAPELLAALEAVIDYAENEASALQNLKDSPTAAAEAEQASSAVDQARAVLAKVKGEPVTAHVSASTDANHQRDAASTLDKLDDWTFRVRDLGGKLGQTYAVDVPNGASIFSSSNDDAAEAHMRLGGCPAAACARLPPSGQSAHSGEDDQPFRPKVITDSGDRDHAVSRTARPGVIVAARRTADVSIGCIRMVGPVKATVDRPWSPWRGPTRVAQCPHERRSGARGEALWAPVGDRRHGAHAAVLSAATSRRRKEGPLSSMR